MDNFDYISENANKRYPFKDNATLLWTSRISAGELSNDALLDALFIIDNTANITPYLISIDYVYNSQASLDTWLFTFQINSTNQGTVLVSASNADSSSYQIVVGTTIQTHYQIRLECSLTGLQRLRSLGQSTLLIFDTTALICQSCIKYVGPIVNSVILSEINQSGDIATIGTITDNFNIQAGTNIQLTGTNSLTIDVIAGAGQGLFDACSLLNNIIYTINNIGADAYGNMALTSDACYTLIPVSNSVQISNTCKAECTNEELAAFAHYLNRVKDGTSDLAGYLATIKASYDALVSAYGLIVSNKSAIKPIYIKTTVTQSNNYKTDYFGITTGIYIPSSSVDGTTTINASTTLGSIYTLIPNSIITSVNGNNLTPSNLTITAMQVGCSGTITERYSISADRVNGVSQKNDGTANFDLNTTASITNSYAYNSTSLIYDIPTFDASVSTIKTTDTNVDIVLTLKSKNTITTNVSLNVEIPDTAIPVINELIINSTKTNVNTTGFTNHSIDFSKPVQYHANIILAGTGSISIPIIMSSTFGVIRKSIPIQL